MPRDFFFSLSYPENQPPYHGPMKDFFISYNGADKNWAEWIAWELEEAGHTTVNQAWDFKAGSNLVLDMQKAASATKRTIAVLSLDYLNALFTQPEWAAAFKDDPTGEKGKLIPVRVRECEPKGLLAAIVYIDLVGREELLARELLLNRINEIVYQKRGKPEMKPSFPKPAKHEAGEKPSFPGADARERGSVFGEVRQKLIQVRKLRDEKLFDDRIAREAQRELKRRLLEN